MQRTVRVSFILFFGFFLGAIQSPMALADRFDTSETQTARALGMGNAGINNERGGLSVFYNPANIAAKSTRAVFQLFNFSLEGSQGLISQSARGSPNVTDLKESYVSLRGNPNNFSSGRVSLFPNITLRNLTLGVLYEQNRGAMVRETDGALYVKSRDRFVPMTALSFRMFSGIIRIGAMAEYLSVGDADRYILSPISYTNMDWKMFTYAGAGISKTAGATFTIPLRYLPSFSFVARDIGGTKLSGSPIGVSGSAGRPENRKMTFDVSGAFTMYWGPRIESKWEVDYRDATNKLQGSRLQRIFAGTEFTLWDIVHLRGGYMHGFPTAGFGIGTSKSSLNLAWYSDEIEGRLRANRDQRFVLQWSSSFIGRQ